jgi:hypothetical protein
MRKHPSRFRVIIRVRQTSIRLTVNVQKKVDVSTSSAAQETLW